MRTTGRESKTAALAAMVFMTAVSALAEEKYRRTAVIDGKEQPAEIRRIMVSLQDRKLALLEGEKVVKIWATAVGAESTPSPSGTYTIVNRLSPLPRDPRGRLSVAGDTIRIHLPGLSCNGTIKPALDLECSQQDSPWPLPIENVHLVPAGNYFTREGLPSFFSASSVKDGGTDLWIVAGVDEHTYLLDRSMAQVGTVEGWGNDIASIDSGCGTGRQILATLPGDPLARGVIQAFEIVNRNAVAASSTVEFPGPITALWPVTNQNAAIAVSRDLKTGRYAAFHLSISCGR